MVLRARFFMGVVVVVGRGCFVVFVVVLFGSCFFFMRQIRQIRHFEKDFSIKKNFFEVKKQNFRAFLHIYIFKFYI